VEDKSPAQHRRSTTVPW